MKIICLRLHRGDDLLMKIEEAAQTNHLQAGVVLSAVGCLSRAEIRDAGGVRIRPVEEPCEIVSLMGTVSATRCHLHISLAREDLSVIGGHLCHGCIINTTCELVLGELAGWRFEVEQDAATGYDEIIFKGE